jgi:hypothetical protein
MILGDSRMLILRITPVIPKQWSWCGLLFAVSISGFIGQVGTSGYWYPSTFA